MNLIGQPLDRIDGLLKVTGEARYAAEFPEARLAHGVLVTSTIARGAITSIDASSAQALPGVLLVMTYQNAPRLPNGGRPTLAPPAGRRLSLLQDNQIHYNNEPVAVVVADTLEHATDAARQLRITYQSSAATLDFTEAKPNGHAPDKPQGRTTDTQRGDFNDGLRSGTVHVDAVLHDADRASQPDGAARHDGALGRPAGSRSTIRRKALAVRRRPSPKRSACRPATCA